MTDLAVKLFIMYLCIGLVALGTYTWMVAMIALEIGCTL